MAETEGSKSCLDHCNVKEVQDESETVLGTGISNVLCVDEIDKSDKLDSIEILDSSVNDHVSCSDATNDVSPKKEEHKHANSDSEVVNEKFPEQVDVECSSLKCIDENRPLPCNCSVTNYQDLHVTNQNEELKGFLNVSEKPSSGMDSLSCDSPIMQEAALEFHHKLECSQTYQNDTNENIPSMYNENSESSYEFDSEIECDNSENGETVTHRNLTPNETNRYKRSRKNRSRAAIEYYEVQLQFLEKNNQKLVVETSELKQQLSSQEAEFKNSQNQLEADFEMKLEKVSKLCETLKKEKEAMVIKYANSEKEVIVLKKSFSDLEKKLRDCNKEKETLSNRVKTLQADRNRLCVTIEQKVSEMNGMQREYEKLKEEVSCKDIKIKWVQNKLKTEMDAHKETQTKLEHTMQRLQEMREEAEQVRRDCQEMIRRYQEAEEIKSVELDHQLRQKLSELEVQRQERSDQEEVYQLLRQELEALKKKQRITIEENNSLTLKIQSLEKERLEYEQTLSKLKDNQNSLKQEVVDLTAHLAEMENLRMQLEREKEKYSASVREVERLRQTNAELQSDMDACHMKEGELLEFTEKLTAKTVHLQSEHSLLETKAQALEEEVAQLNKLQCEMKQKNGSLTSLLEEEKKQRREETQLLARKLAEKTKAVEQLTVKLEEAENENRVMKRRHITSIKELSRELQQCRKRAEMYECNSCPPALVEKSSLGSRASSSASLDNMNNILSNSVVSTAVSAPQISPPVAFSGKNSSTSQSSLPASAIPNEVNKQMLVERIVKLQKMLAKRNDKIEFLEDHISQLVKEMKKKSKIIQNYIVKAEAGALTSNTSDQNKLPKGRKIKMDLAKRGGIMASVYRSQLSDNNMTLDLSLEINHKLQAVLEDTLLKNITLKENINTLGEEIARLTSEKRELSRQVSRTKCIK